MTSRRRTVTTAASRHSTPPPDVAEAPVRRSPQGLPRLNYREKRTRSSSSMGSTARFFGTSTCLKIQLKASLINSSGETKYRGSGVFLLSERAHRSTLHVCTRVILAEVRINSGSVDPVTEVPRFDYEHWRAKQREDLRKLRKQPEEIAKVEAKLKEQRRASEVAQARAEKRKVGEPSVPAPSGYHSPCSGELEVVKLEESDEPEACPIPHVRIQTPST